MINCPRCHHAFEEPAEYPCCISGCNKESVWEGYRKVGDMIRLSEVCEEHKKLLIGYLSLEEK